MPYLRPNCDRTRTRAGQGGLDPAMAARCADPDPAGAVPVARLHLSEPTMLVHFRSPATETITMFEDVAVRSAQAHGRHRTCPRRPEPDDVPAAMQRLEAAVEQMKTETHADTTARPPTTKTRPTKRGTGPLAAGRAGNAGHPPAQPDEARRCRQCPVVGRQAASPLQRCPPVPRASPEGPSWAAFSKSESMRCSRAGIAWRSSSRASARTSRSR